MPGATPFKPRDATAEDWATMQAWVEQLVKLDHLYTYKSLRGEGFARVYDIVTRSQFYFSGFTGFNDPFDGQVWPNYDGTDAEKRALMVDAHADSGQPLDEAKIMAFLALPTDEQSRRAHSVHVESSASRGVACFTEKETDLPMWAYYADSHRGVCLRFRSPMLLEWRAGLFPPIPVTYSDHYPDVSLYRDTRFKRIRAEVGTKAEVWRHEREWRIVRQGAGYVPIDPAALDGVILGCRIGGEEEARVKDMLARREPTVELLRAEPAEREFKLDIRPA